MPTLNTCKKNELINNFYKKINENPDKKSKYSDDKNEINFENTFKDFVNNKKYAIDYIESESLLINFIGAVDYDFRNVKENGDLITYFCRDLPNQLKKFPFNTSNSNGAIKIRTLINNGCLEFKTYKINKKQIERWESNSLARHNNEPEKNIIVNAINFFSKNNIKYETSNFDFLDEFESKLQEENYNNENGVILFSESQNEKEEKEYKIENATKLTKDIAKRIHDKFLKISYSDILAMLLSTHNAYFPTTKKEFITALKDGLTYNFNNLKLEIPTEVLPKINENFFISKKKDENEKFMKPYFPVLHFFQSVIYACMLVHANSETETRKKMTENIFDLVEIFQEKPEQFSFSSENNSSMDFMIKKICGEIDEINFKKIKEIVFKLYANLYQVQNNLENNSNDNSEHDSSHNPVTQRDLIDLTKNRSLKAGFISKESGEFLIPYCIFYEKVNNENYVLSDINNENYWSTNEDENLNKPLKDFKTTKTCHISELPENVSKLLTSEQKKYLPKKSEESEIKNAKDIDADFESTTNSNDNPEDNEIMNDDFNSKKNLNDEIVDNNSNDTENIDNNFESTINSNDNPENNEITENNPSSKKNLNDNIEIISIKKEKFQLNKTELNNFQKFICFLCAPIINLFTFNIFSAIIFGLTFGLGTTILGPIGFICGIVIGNLLSTTALIISLVDFIRSRQNKPCIKDKIKNKFLLLKQNYEKKFSFSLTNNEQPTTILPPSNNLNQPQNMIKIINTITKQ